MLVVDRVELVAFHQPIQMRKLHGDDASRLEQDLHPGDKIVECGHVRQYVVTEQQIRLAGLARDLACRLPPEEAHGSGNSLFLGNLRNVCRWFHTKHRDAGAHKVLEQVAIVTGYLNYAAPCVKPEAPYH